LLGKSLDNDEDFIDVKIEAAESPQQPTPSRKGKESIQDEEAEERLILDEGENHSYRQSEKQETAKHIEAVKQNKESSPNTAQQNPSSLATPQKHNP